MRRFRRRRRRAAALALLPIAVITTQSSFAAEPAERAAEIDASAKTVAIGDSVTLRGTFPGAANAAVEIRYRPAGGGAWKAAGRAKTGTGGRYHVEVEPRRNGFWRAELAEPAAVAAPAEATATTSGVDAGTGTEKVIVRSETTTHVKGRDALVGKQVTIAGTVAPAGAARRVVVRVGNDKEAVKAGRDGRFRLGWKAPTTGTYPVRVIARANAVAAGSSDRAGKVTAFRGAAASWYGPGLYGNPLACGGTLSTGTMGVAHKTLPCGTKVTLRYGNQQVRVPVIDRGPFAGNREYDLTAATRQALGFPDVGTVLTDH